MPLIPSLPAFLGGDDYAANQPDISAPIDFHSLTDTYGADIPVIVEFAQPLTEPRLAELSANGIRFALGPPEMSRVGDYYVLRGSADGLSTMQDTRIFASLSLQTPVGSIHPTRDVSIPEIQADTAWAMLDGMGENVTGEGILIADLDSGVDWRHPDLWFADGGSYDWFESGAPDSLFTNGTDFVDLNVDLAKQASETLYAIDLDRDSNFDTSTEWIWADNVTQDGKIQVGEPFFVVNDTNDNDRLDPGEHLIMLKTPKTKLIVEGDGTASREVQAWIRGTNLTATNHIDTNGHGTAVAGILLGGQLGFRKYVGVAPNAELMMIRVLSEDYASNDWLYLEEGLTYAFTHGADVILTEIGSWTYEYLDGSSAAATIIDTIVASGIPVISPSGNLGGSMKHARFVTTPNTRYLVDFDIPVMAQEINEVYITALSRNVTDFSSMNFSLVMNLQSWGGSTNATVYLHPGSGYLNWFTDGPLAVGNLYLWVDSFISTSSRNTKMLGIRIWAENSVIPPPNNLIPLPTIGAPPFNMFNVTSPAATTFHTFISDSASSWSGGAIWMTDVTDDYHISWPSTADSALSVASYRTRSLVSPGTIGDIASFSGRGPRIDDTEKQGIAAPGGYDVISDLSNSSGWSSWYNAFGALPFDQRFGSYRLFSGTSASGPHVAGAAALMLQVNASAGTDVASIIMSTATVDGFTGSVHNPIWGEGKLNVSAAVEALLEDTRGPTIGAAARDPTTPIDSDSVEVTVSVVTDPSGVDSVILEYFNGTFWNNVTMIWNGTHFVATIPALSTGTTVTYRIHSNDTLDNWSTSPDYQYTVGATTTTTITTTTTGTGTTTTSTTSTTTSTTPVLPEEPDYLMIAIMLGFVLLLIVFSIALSRRRAE
jgi:subtilisin family serine protease